MFKPRHKREEANKVKPAENHVPAATLREDEIKLACLKVDFYERSARIVKHYGWHRESIMTAICELLANLTGFSFSLIIDCGTKPIIFGTPLPQMEVYCENLRNVRPYILDSTLRYPAITFPTGFLVWHNSNTVYLAAEEFLHLAAQHICGLEENIRLIEKLSRQSAYDVQTGLWSKDYLMQIAGRDMLMASRYKHEMALVAVSIMDFERYSSVYGEMEALALINIATEALASLYTPEVIIARQNRSEFLMLFPHTSTEEIAGCEDKIKNVLHQKLQPPLTKRAVRIATGACFFPNESRDLQQMVKRAEDRAYIAGKEDGCIRLKPREVGESA